MFEARLRKVRLALLESRRALRKPLPAALDDPDAFLACEKALLARLEVLPGAQLAVLETRLAQLPYAAWTYINDLLHQALEACEAGD